MSEFHVDDVAATNGKLRYSYTVSGELRRFFTDDAFFVAHDPDSSEGDERIDLSMVPDHILTIPLLANVCPIVWATDGTVHVDSIDREFRDSLRSVRRSLAAMYPDLFEIDPTRTDAAIRADEIVDQEHVARVENHTAGPPTDAVSSRSALLFSGGVDSLASYLGYRAERPLLIGVHGADIYMHEDEAWQRTRDELVEFADTHGEDVRFIRANMRSFIDTTMLLAHYKRYLHDNWFCCVQHGLALLGQCAPLAYTLGIDRIYLAATHSESFDRPWGSHPSIDDAVAWSGTTARHDGYDLTRQEKIERIASYIRDEHEELTIRSCYQSEVGGNCNRCEKCARTAVGLLLAELDPNRHGYTVDGESFDRIRRQLEAGDWTLGPDERFMWDDLQRHADPERTYPWPEAETLVKWLDDADVASVADETGEPTADRLVRAAARAVPYEVYETLYPAYRTISDRQSAIGDRPSG